MNGAPDHVRCKLARDVASPDEATLVGSDDSDEYQTPSEMLIEASG